MSADWYTKWFSCISREKSVIRVQNSQNVFWQLSKRANIQASTFWQITKSILPQKLWFFNAGSITCVPKQLITWSVRVLRKTTVLRHPKLSFVTVNIDKLNSESWHQLRPLPAQSFAFVWSKYFVKNYDFCNSRSSRCLLTGILNDPVVFWEICPQSAVKNRSPHEKSLAR